MERTRQIRLRDGLVTAVICCVVWSWSVLPVTAQIDSRTTQPPPRVALVIGNSAYQNVTPLPNPGNDAQIIAEKLWESGFEVIESIDADRETMLASLATFRSRLRDGSEAVVYYAGHGVRIGSRNYLLPVSVSPTSVEELKAQSIDAQLFINVMNESGAKLNIILLDACRNNPFDHMEDNDAERIASRAISVGASRDAVMQGLAELSEAGDGGLAEMSAGKTETLISFATAPGSVALDGDGRHSPYTQSIADNIDEPGLEIGQLFRRVRGDVRENTNGGQITWTTSTLESDFYFKPPNSNLRGATTGMSTATDTLGALPPRRIVDRAFWRAIQDSNRVDAFQAYLRTRPDGAFVEQARNRVLELGGTLETVGTLGDLLPNAQATRGLQLGSDNARADANDSLARADVTVPIGAGEAEIAVDVGAEGSWVYVPNRPRLGQLAVDGTDQEPAASVYWLNAGSALKYVPTVGSNGGVEKVAAERLGGGGQTDDFAVEIEAFVHACDMLAGMPQDSQRVTAGARQFIVNRNFDAAIVACEIATEDHPDIPRFWAQLARAYRAAGRYEEALEWQLKAVEADYLAAVVNLGQMYLDGQAVETDPHKAFELFTYAADRGEPAAYTALAWVYRAGVGVTQDYREAMAWYTRGASAGNDWAMTNIAELHQTGKGVPKNAERAVKWYTDAAQSGELTAQTRLARMYQTGDGIAQDFAQARFWFETAAGRGVPNALTRLGIMYEEGQGQDADLDAAFRLYSNAAMEGDDEALFRIGKIYASGKPPYDDPERAAALLALATERDVYGSHRELAQLYEKGKGVEKDSMRAIALYQIAAEGNPWAARDVGRVFASEVGDFEQAGVWFRRGSDGGVPWASRDLARLYESGSGVAKDRNEALIMYATAIGQSADANLRKLIDEAVAGYGENEFVAAAQTLLTRRGASVGVADGQMGPNTRKALEAAFAELGEAAPDAAITIDTLAVLTRR
jgi:uncharacterized protein